jgi:pimeloyl-ACP methyl ester carboxylesterase
MTPLVLVHGLSGSGRWWRGVRDRLDDGRDVHVVDVPRIHPHGAPRWLLGWLDGAGIDRVDLVGHSLGGLTCARTAALAPPRVRRLVLVAPAGVPTRRRLSDHAAPLAATLAQVRTRAPRIAVDALRAGPMLLSGALYAATHDLRAELQRVEAPTLLVWGKRDQLVPARLAEEWLRALRDARAVFIDAGHVPMWDAPESLAAAVLDFLQERANQAGDELRPRVVDRVGLTGDEREPPVR